jgi:hypothetical protein
MRLYKFIRPTFSQPQFRIWAVVGITVGKIGNGRHIRFYMVRNHKIEFTQKIEYVSRMPKLLHKIDCTWYLPNDFM